MNKSSLPFINTGATIIISLVFLLFPLFFLTTTTEFYTFPKQVLVVTASLLLFILWTIRNIAERKVTLLNNPLNIPVLIFTVIIILSTVFSTSIQDSIIQMVPVALLGVFFFAVVNFLQDKSSYAVALISLIVGTLLSALVSVFARFEIYVFPMEVTRNTFFNTFGAQVQYIAFLTPILVLCVASLTTIFRDKKSLKNAKNASTILHLVSGIIFLGSIISVALQIASSGQKTILLPFNHGFQIAFATISQDASRLAQSLLLGSGYGTFMTDFTRFVSPSFNNSSDLWNLTFSFSSSYILELLATTGVLGLAALAYIFVNFIRSRKSFTHPLFLSVLSVFVLSLFIPFSYAIVFLLFALLALYVAHRAIENAKEFENVELNMVAFKKGIISLTEEHPRSKKEGLILPFVVLVLAIGVALFIGFYLTGAGDAPRKGFYQLVSSDMKFAKSLTAESLQNGASTYELQSQAIQEFPFRGDYYRLFSQINLVLAANLVTAQNGQTPSEEVQQNIIGLLQRSINAGRQSVTLSPYTAANWQSLGQIYRNLIGVGQNAEQFALASYNQAIALSPSSPALRIELGGIYYQLQQWDLALNQFNIASQLKPDYANAYYNLGKAYEQKGELQTALAQYQVVKQLVANDTANTTLINQEIKALEDKIGQQAKGGENVTPTEDNTPLGVNQPAADFPDRDPKEEIQAPPKGPDVATPTPSQQNSSPTPAE